MFLKKNHLSSSTSKNPSFHSTTFGESSTCSKGTDSTDAVRIIHIHNNMYVYAWVGLGQYRVQNSRLYLNKNLLGKLQIVPKNGTSTYKFVLILYYICTDKKLKRELWNFKK